MNVHEAWNEVMRAVREIRKDERASGGGANYHFRGVDAVMNAVGPIFRDVGVSCVPIEVKQILTRDFKSKSGTNMHEAIVIVRYRVTGPEGDSFEGECIGESSDASDKAVAQAMSVAYRTFLLQGLTMPTDDPDPDHQWTDRSDPDNFEAQGWTTEGERETTFEALVAESGDLPEDLKAKLREWVSAQGITPETLTADHAAAWRKALDKAQDAGDWPSLAEKERTTKSLASRIAKLPAFEAEALEEDLASEGIDPSNMTKAQSTRLLTLIIEAEEIAGLNGGADDE